VSPGPTTARGTMGCCRDLQTSLHAGVRVSSAATDLLELTEENVEKVLDEVSAVLHTAAQHACMHSSQCPQLVGLLSVLFFRASLTMPAARMGCQSGSDSAALHPGSISCSTPPLFVTPSTVFAHIFSNTFLAHARCGRTSWLMAATWSLSR
jgi:hypothetical protein